METDHKLIERVSSILGRDITGDRSDRPIYDLCDEVERLRKALE